MSRQLALPLEPGAQYESALKRAWARTSRRIPYDVAIRNRALAICLRNIAAAETRGKPQRPKARPDKLLWQRYQRQLLK